MALRLDDRWLWDFWLAQDGADTHLFYLQADRALRDERLRHWHVSIGHAVSQDLRAWKVLPDALGPSPMPAPGTPEPFDSYTTWTGSILRHAGGWAMFYTGSRRSENGLIQRIGMATSPDLMRWTKHPANPLIEADPAWYELLDLNAWHDQAWRDPWVFQHPATGEFHALITARGRSGPPDGRGVIGHATSSDLRHWTAQPPLTPPGRFGHMEVPQLVHIGPRWYLLFSVPGEHFAASYQARPGIVPQTGTHYLVADDPLGPYRFLTEAFLLGDTVGTLYSGKLVQLPEGGWGLLAFRNADAAGGFVGELIDPIRVNVQTDGRLTLDTAG